MMAVVVCRFVAMAVLVEIIDTLIYMPEHRAQQAIADDV